MVSSSEVCQDIKPHSYSMLLKSFVDQPDQTQKLEEFLARLEEECLKIEAFRRELPLCMQLLTNAIEAYRQQLQSYRGNQQETNKPVLEEFIPLKHSSSEGSEKTSSISEKSSWMVSAQLWSQSNDENKQQMTITSSPKETDQSFSPKLSLDDKKKNGGGAFLPFTKERNTCANPNTLRVLSDLALASTDDHKELNDKIKGGNGGTIISEQGKTGTGTGTGTGAGNQSEVQAASTNSQTHRKARRCWSPDLHRRFVNALHMLGGSQVATPKQIREFMKVDGLTNDEVKSHLQKYRLHTRRPSPSHQAAGNQAPQLVVLGSIWVPPEYTTAAHGGGGPTIYSAHPASLASTHYCAPQEFYPAPPTHQLHHTIHHPHPHPHHQPHVYKTSSKTHSSPESDTQGAGDRSESIEDGKSESSSWKGDSGENGGERRGLASLRDEGEKSDGNEITLSF
ncbi:Myb family transcription factor efm [Thalictrum thalictroides]|uniref:Myb family transcription factor efm n=1 Tax=Thalictrum thalictroides TaxID=46969 RepID=A0A7J6VXR9_THATH|nr:Myb family transcription factor efm [Thalictrum thalictroides]